MASVYARGVWVSFFLTIAGRDNEEISKNRAFSLFFTDSRFTVIFEFFKTATTARKLTFSSSTRHFFAF